MRWDNGAAEAGTRFSASPDAVEGYGGRGVDGTALPFADWPYFQRRRWNLVVGYLPAAAGFRLSRGSGSRRHFLACSASYDEVVRVKVLAFLDVHRADAEAGVPQRAPGTDEEAVAASRLVPDGVP